MAVSGPVIVHMFIISSRDAILDLSAFMSLKKTLVLLFMALKNLSPTPIPEHSAAVFQPELPEDSRVPRAPSTTLERPAQEEERVHGAPGPRYFDSQELPGIDIYRSLYVDLPFTFFVVFFTAISLLPRQYSLPDQPERVHLSDGAWEVFFHNYA
jgi:hypothetical protein